MPKISPYRKSNEKWCSGCNKFHLKSSFYRNIKRKDGYASWCKECSKRHELTYKRKKYVPDKSKIRWWNIKANRRKLSVKGEFFYSLYIDNPRCYYCQVSLENIDVHIDHKTPLSRSGTHESNNLVLSCEDCNRLKNNKTEQEFRDFLKIYCIRFENKQRVTRRKRKHRERLNEKTPKGDAKV